MKKSNLIICLIIIIFIFSGCSNNAKILSPEETIQCINNNTVNKYKGYETELKGYVSNTIGKYNNANIGFELRFDERSGINRNVLIDISDISENMDYSEYQINTPVSVNAIALKQNNISVFKAKAVKKIEATEVVNPTVEELAINAEEENYGNSIIVEKIQFAERETRVFIKVKNTKDEYFNLNGMTAVQGNTNYNEWNTYGDIYDIQLAKGTETQVVYYTEQRLNKQNIKFAFDISSDMFNNIPNTGISKYTMELKFENDKYIPYVQHSKELGKNFVLGDDFSDEFGNYYIRKKGDDSFVVYMPNYGGEFLGTYDIDIALADKDYWCSPDIPTYVYIDTIKVIKEYNY